MDADKEGFLRNEKSLTQTAGRAARNANGKVLFYADKITESMRKTIEETNRRRTKQQDYNLKHNIIPVTLSKTREEILAKKSILDIRDVESSAYVEPDRSSIAADPLMDYLDKDQIKRLINEIETKMKKAAKELDFISAAQYRDEINLLKKKL
jgi:excinuclease ABC subunit B